MPRQPRPAIAYRSIRLRADVYDQLREVQIRMELAGTKVTLDALLAHALEQASFWSTPPKTPGVGAPCSWVPKS